MGSSGDKAFFFFLAQKQQMLQAHCNYGYISFSVVVKEKNALVHIWKQVKMLVRVNKVQ
jgi:hypothetical protein